MGMTHPAPVDRSHHAGSNRGGFALVLYAVMIPALIAIASLAVDFGRVELAKTEMRGAVDAAARAACAYIPSDLTSARAAAITAASRNTVDGVSLELRTQDVVFGRWDTSTKTFDAASSSPNAVRISAYRTAGRSNPIPLPIASAIGVAAKDVSMSQITMAIPSTGQAIVGLNSIEAKNNLFVSSYNSSVTTSPSQSSHNGAGGMSSNGQIKGKNGNELWGQATLGPSGSISNVNVSGGIVNSTTDVPTPSSPAWSPGTNPGGVSQTFSSSGTSTLAGGTYWFTSMDVSGTLSFSGPAILYVKGDADINGTMRAYNSVPSNLKIYIVGNYAFGNTKNNNTDITADIEGPAASFYVKNNLTFRGRMVFDTIEFKNNAELYYDEAFGSASGIGSVTTVQ